MAKLHTMHRCNTHGWVVYVGLMFAGTGCGKTEATKLSATSPAKPKQAAPVQPSTPPLHPPRPEPGPVKQPKTQKAPPLPPLSKAELKKLKLTREKFSSDQHWALQEGQLLLFGKKYDAPSYCPPDIAVEPDSFELYSIPGHPNYLVTLCTGSLDATPNVVSVFRQDQKVKHKTVDPKWSSYRIEDPKLVKTAKRLLQEFQT